MKIESAYQDRVSVRTVWENAARRLPAKPGDREAAIVACAFHLNDLRAEFMLGKKK